MLKLAKKAVVVAIMMVPFSSNVVWAEENAALTQRLDRLERIIQGQGLVSLLSRVDQLQNEVQRLNGENESLNHKLEQIQRRQRELYLDLDERLQLQAATATTPEMMASPVVMDVQVEPKPVDSIKLINGETPLVPSATVSEPTPSAQKTAAIEPTIEEMLTAPDATPVAVENGEAAYQAALKTLRSGQYEQAVAAFESFPEQYPQSTYLPNAYYWMGEAHLVLANFDKAVSAFQAVIDIYPDSRKMPDAMLKKGFAQYSLGRIEESKATLTTVIHQYSTTSAARLAKVKLERIKQASN